MKQISSPVFAISAGLYLVVASLLINYAYKVASVGGKYPYEYSEIADLFTPMSFLVLLSILFSILFLVITYARLSTLKIKWKIPIFVVMVLLFLLAPSFFGMLPMLVIIMLKRKSSLDGVDIQPEQKSGLTIHPFFKPSLFKIILTILLYVFYSLSFGYVAVLALGGGSSGSEGLIESFFSATFFILDWFFLYPLSFIKSGFMQFDTMIIPIILCYLWSCVVYFPFRKKVVREVVG